MIEAFLLIISYLIFGSLTLAIAISIIDVKKDEYLTCIFAWPLLLPLFLSYLVLKWRASRRGL